MPPVLSTLNASISPGTRAKYVTAIQQFASFCDAQQVTILPLDMQTLAEFFDPLVTGKAFTQIQVLVAAIKWYAEISVSPGKL